MFRSKCINYCYTTGGKLIDIVLNHNLDNVILPTGMQLGSFWNFFINYNDYFEKIRFI